MPTADTDRQTDEHTVIHFMKPINILYKKKINEIPLNSVRLAKRLLDGAIDFSNKNILH